MPYKEGRRWRATPKYKGIRGKTRSCRTKKEAMEWEMAEKKRLKEIALRQQRGMDLLTMCGRYLDYAERYAVKTYQEKRAVCKRILKAWGKDCIVDTITPAMVEKYLIAQKNNRSANASNVDRKNLIAMFNHAIKFYGVKSNPFADISKFPHNQSPHNTPRRLKTF